MGKRDSIDDPDRLSNYAKQIEAHSMGVQIGFIVFEEISSWIAIDVQRADAVLRRLMNVRYRNKLFGIAMPWVR